MSEDSRERLERFLAAVSGLPPTRGLSYRGLGEGDAPPAQTVVTRLLTATSRDVGVATLGARLRRVVAVIGGTGRDISALSADRAGAETVFLPGSMFVPQGSVQVDDVEVWLVEEVVAVDGQMYRAGSDLDRETREVVAAVRAELSGSRSAEESVAGRDRFVGPLE